MVSDSDPLPDELMESHAMSVDTTRPELVSLIDFPYISDRVRVIFLTISDTDEKGIKERGFPINVLRVYLHRYRFDFISHTGS